MAGAHVILDALLVRANPTGVGRSILELTRALAAADRGLDFTVLATAPEMFSTVARVPRWRVVHCPGATGGTLRKAWYTQVFLPGLVRKLGGDLLHSLQFVAPLRLECPSVVTVHDLAWLQFPGTVEEPRASYYRLLVPRSLDRAAVIVTNSDSTAADVARLYPDTSARVQVTPFGTPSWVWQQPETADYEVTRRARPYFLFVGTLEPRKNLVGLLTAYELFLEAAESRQHPVSAIPQLVFVGGRGWRDSRLRRRMQDLQSRNQLQVLDYCGLEELWKHYRGARALLFPSLHEGFGFPILEAMAAGLPVMTSRRGAMAEVAGQNAILVNPDRTDELVDSMCKLAWDNDLREMLADRGPDRARAWNWATTAECTVAVYQQVLSAGKSA